MTRMAIRRPSSRLWPSRRAPSTCTAMWCDYQPRFSNDGTLMRNDENVYRLIDRYRKAPVRMGGSLFAWRNQRQPRQLEQSPPQQDLPFRLSEMIFQRANAAASATMPPTIKVAITPLLCSRSITRAHIDRRHEPVSREGSPEGRWPFGGVQGQSPCCQDSPLTGVQGRRPCRRTSIYTISARAARPNAVPTENTPEQARPSW